MPTTSFEKFCRKELVPADADVQRLEQSDRLTGAAFMAEALANARTTPEHVAKLRAQIEQATDLPHVQQFIRNLVRVLSEPAPATGEARGSYPRPPAKRLSPFGREDAVIGQAARLQSNPIELVAVAATIAVEQHPESFGRIKNWPEHLRQQTAARELLRLLDERVPVELNLAEDALFDRSGRPSVKLTAGEVAVHPLDNLGARLRSWLRQHPEAVRR